MTLRTLFIVALAFLAAPAWAQGAKPAASGDPVVARVNGAEIHRSEVVEAIRNLPPQAQQQPPEKVYPLVLDQLVATTLIAQAAKKAKFTDEPTFKKRLALLQEQYIAESYMQRLAEKGITDKDLHANYDKFVKNAPPREEVSARHILLANEEDAKAVIAELKKGADFAKLAAEKTTDPAGKTSGGNLGYFTKEEMVPEFAEAAFKLKKGEFTETPVKTQFGWHVIKLEDRRQAKPPSFDQVKPQLTAQLGREVAGKKLKELQAAAKIEVFNADGSKPGAKPQKSEPAPAPAAPDAPALAPGTAPDALGAPTLAPATKP